MKCFITLIVFCLFLDKSWMHTPEALAKHFIAYNVKVCVMNLFFH